MFWIFIVGSDIVPICFHVFLVLFFVFFLDIAQSKGELDELIFEIDQAQRHYLIAKNKYFQEVFKPDSHDVDPKEVTTASMKVVHQII